MYIQIVALAVVAHHHRVVHVEFADERLCFFGFTRRHSNADDLQSLTAVFFLEAIQFWYFIDAGFAPGRPEVEYYDASAESRAVERLAVHIEELKLRHLLLIVSDIHSGTRKRARRAKR